MASDDHPGVYDEDDESEEEDLVISTPSHTQNHLDTATDDDSPDRYVMVPVPASADHSTNIIRYVPAPANSAAKKPPAALESSRGLFQRLWTDEDEIELLQGFLQYTARRGWINSSQHHDTSAFYDEIKSKLQLDFNKNQLVEKLRRLKKKYRTISCKMSTGKEYFFKSPHDKITFEISRKIWSGSSATIGDDESIPSFPNPNPNSVNFNGIAASSPAPRSRKRSRELIDEPTPISTCPPLAISSMKSISSLIEETVKLSVSPLLKELLQSVTNVQCSYGFVGLNPLPLSFCGLRFAGSDEVLDEKWRKQHILELEVCSRRLELVQDQIKSALDELRSKGG